MIFILKNYPSFFSRFSFNAWALAGIEVMQPPTRWITLKPQEGSFKQFSKPPTRRITLTIGPMDKLAQIHNQEPTKKKGDCLLIEP